jgi:hypothetical protein
MHGDAAECVLAAVEHDCGDVAGWIAGGDGELDDVLRGGNEFKLRDDRSGGGGAGTICRLRGHGFAYRIAVRDGLSSVDLVAMSVSAASVRIGSDGRR